MKNTLLALLLAFVLIGIPHRSFCWSKKGHELVAEVAFHYLDSSTKEKVQKVLGKMSIEDAANWMDEMRSNDFYSYMKTWHYIDIEKGEKYSPVATDRNIVIILNSSINELRHRDSLKEKNIKTDVLILFHLIGDLHQPLHTGYPGDKGGNTINVSFLSGGNSTNLHHVWDDEIIQSKNISLEDCIKQYDSYTPEQIKDIEKIKVLQWMNQSRMLLDGVYNFKDDFLDQNYVDSNAVVIQKQILIAGLRLASVLRECFKD